MSIHVRYFASLKETLGKSDDFLALSETVTLAEIWTLANPNKVMPEKTLIAVNLEYAELDKVINAGDEVAFFPPVTGG
ncbi:MAG: MoaD/ThiS family protein [Methylococcales bacterium]|nr:MoaD/ThiS family protein [Methylococcales bacterium]